MVDRAFARYATLYSGGSHWRRLDNVGATLDLYRLWKGLPDRRLRSTFQPPEWNDDEFNSKDVETVIKDPVALWQKGGWALTSRGPAKPDRQQAFWAGFGLDILTSAGPSPDWWRRARDFSDLTEMQAWVARKAKSEPGLDWLQMTLAASNAPWANSWPREWYRNDHSVDPYRRMSEAALQRYLKGEGLQWLVVAALNAPRIAGRGDLFESLEELRNRAKTCEATPGEYAAYAAVLFATERSMPELQVEYPEVAPLYADLPASVRYPTALARLQAYVLSSIGSGEEPSHLYLFKGKALQSVPQLKVDVELAQLYAANKIADVPSSSSGYVRRAYNLLSAEHLTVLARRKGADPSLARVAFARQVALGRTAKAKALLGDLKRASPADAERIEAIWKKPWSEQARLALIVLETPNLSTVVKGGEAGDYDLYQYWIYMEDHRNLSAEYTSAAFLQRDFEVWLRLPNRYSGVGNERGASDQWIVRAVRRPGFEARQDDWHYVIAQGPSQKSFPFVGLIAWNEVGSLTRDRKLMGVVAPQIVAWAAGRAGTASEREYAATSLAKLIALCRFNDCGAQAGGPTPQRAYELLRRKFGDTEAAKSTKWWYLSDH